MTKAVRSWGLDGGSVSMVAVDALRHALCCDWQLNLCCVHTPRSLCRLTWPSAAKKTKRFNACVDRVSMLRARRRCVLPPSKLASGRKTLAKSGRGIGDLPTVLTRNVCAMKDAACARRQRIGDARRLPRRGAAD